MHRSLSKGLNTIFKVFVFSGNNHDIVDTLKGDLRLNLCDSEKARKKINPRKIDAEDFTMSSQHNQLQHTEADRKSQHTQT